jgi:DNA-binding NarL/FixJ family response regulator
MPSAIKIIVVDDHPLFREGVAHSLAAEPEFEVLAEASSGEEGVDLVRRLQPDLVVMDLNMAGAGGVAATATISALYPQVRILILTVTEQEDGLLAALKAGAHGYILKGVAAGEFRSIVRRVASGEVYVTPSLAAQILGDFSRPRAADTLSHLSPRESEVLELLGHGFTNREIGERLHLAEKTVKHHMTNILQKLHVRSRTEAALVSVRRNHPGPAH